MREALRDYILIGAGTHYLLKNEKEIWRTIRNWIIAMSISIVLVILVILTMISLITATIGILFCVGYLYASVYKFSPVPCSILMLLSSASFYGYMVSASQGTDVSISNPLLYLASLFFLIFSVFTFTLSPRPVTATKYNSIRFGFVMLYALITMMIGVTPLSQTVGVLPPQQLSSAQLEDLEDDRKYGLTDLEWEDREIEHGRIQDRKSMAVVGSLFFIGGLFLNHLFFGRFQWRHLQGYVDLVQKYGTKISEKDSALFRAKLDARFPNGWDLVKERDNPDNKWDDRIMFAYLKDHLPVTI